MIKKSYVVAIIVTMVLAAPGLDAFAASSPGWSATLKAHLWDGQAGKKGPLAIGTVVSVATLNSEGGVQSPAYDGDTGWATASIQHYLYPIVTHDHGKSWRVGGVYFAVPIAKSFYYVSTVKIFRTQVVAIYARGSVTFDITNDGGQHWYQTFFPGLIRSVTNYVSSGAALEGAIRVKIQSNPDSPARTGYYVSRNGGISWKLSSTK